MYRRSAFAPPRRNNDVAGKPRTAEEGPRRRANAGSGRHRHAAPRSRRHAHPTRHGDDRLQLCRLPEVHLVFIFPPAHDFLLHGVPVLAVVTQLDGRFLTRSPFQPLPLSPFFGMRPFPLLRDRHEVLKGFLVVAGRTEKLEVREFVSSPALDVIDGGSRTAARLALPPSLAPRQPYERKPTPFCRSRVPRTSLA